MGLDGQAGWAALGDEAASAVLAIAPRMRNLLVWFMLSPWSSSSLWPTAIDFLFSLLKWCLLKQGDSLSTPDATETAKW